MASETCLRADVLPRWLHDDRQEEHANEEGIRHICRGWKPVKLPYVRGDILGFQEARCSAERSGEKDGVLTSGKCKCNVLILLPQMR